MGVLGRRSRPGDTAEVAVARLRRGAHDVLDAVTEAVGDAASATTSVTADLGDRVGTQVTAARRDLADRIDPAPVSRRGLRLLVLGLLVTTVSAVVWAVLARRPASSTTHGAPEHLPPTGVDDADDIGDADEVIAVEVVEVDVVELDRPADDEPPAAGLTGDPESRST